MSSDLPPIENQSEAESKTEEDQPIVSDVKLVEERLESGTPKLGRLHPMSLVFDVISHVRTLIIPAVIAVFSAASGSTGGLIFAAVIFIPTLIQSFIRYFSLRYSIRDSELVVTQGIFFRRNRTVPVNRIQNINLVQNILHRIMRVAEVRIETASGTEPEATLRVLSINKVELLRDSIFEQQRTTVEQPSTDLEKTDAASTKPLTDAATTDTLLTIPSNLLIRAGLASNKGTLLLGVLLGVIFQFDEQIEAWIDFKAIVEMVGQQATNTANVLVGILAVIAILLLFRLLGVAWYVLRFSGYRLTSSGEDFRIQCGLLTKVSASVPRKRIQFISIHRNLIMRWMKLASIRIETAGGAGKGHEDATKTVSSKWFIPVLREDQVKPIIERLRPGLVWQEDSFDWKPISPLAASRLSRIAIFASILIAIGGSFALWPWGWSLGVLAAPILVFLAIKRTRSKKYARTNDVIVYRSGIFTHKTSLTFFEKIQTVMVDETPFDRRWKMASLCVDTAAAGPADHQIHIKYLTEDFARNEYKAIIKQAADQLPVYG